MYIFHDAGDVEEVHEKEDVIGIFLPC